MGDSYTTTVIADELEHHLDADHLEAPVAAAIAEAVRDGIAGIREQVSPATLAYREKARRALAKGKRWAVARYAGREPGSTTHMFNDSGALAAGVAVEQLGAGAGYAITVPARLQAEGGDVGLQVQRLGELAPVVADPTRDRRVVEAIERATDSAFTLIERVG